MEHQGSNFGWPHGKLMLYLLYFLFVPCSVQFFLFIWGGHTCKCPGIIPISVLRDNPWWGLGNPMGCQDQTWVGYIQSQCPTHCNISLTLILSILFNKNLFLFNKNIQNNLFMVQSSTAMFLNLLPIWYLSSDLLFYWNSHPKLMSYPPQKVSFHWCCLPWTILGSLKALRHWEMLIYYVGSSRGLPVLSPIARHL